MRRHILTTLLALVAVACAEGGAVGPKPRLVVLIAIDDLRADHLPAYGYDSDPAPYLSALAEQGTVFGDHVTSSTAINASVASLLTGLDVDHHGVRSVHDVGRHRLPLARFTLAEGFQARGFFTVAAISRRQLEGTLSGLGQGFDRYLDEDLPKNGEPRRAQDVAVDLLEAWVDSLGSAPSVFFFLHLGDLGDPGAPDAESLVASLRARLAARGTTPSDELAGAMATVTDPTVDTRAEIARLVGRRRGTPEWKAYVEAEYDAALAVVDEMVGAFTDSMRTASLFGGEVEIVVVGTRGRYLIESRPDGELEGFSEGLIHTACIVYPRIGDVARVDFPTDARDVAAVLWAKNRAGLLAEWQAAADVGERFAIVDSPRVGGRAVVGPEWKIWPEMQGDACQVVQRADDSTADVDALPAGYLALYAAALAPRDGFGLMLPVGWELRTPRAAVRSGPDFGPGIGDEVLPYYLRVRDPACVVRVPGAAPSGFPVPLLPSERGDAWEHEGAAPPPWVVDVAKTSGRKCAITVTAAAGAVGDTVRVWIARYPTDDEVEALEVTADPAVHVLSEPTLPGATVVEGTLPFRVEVVRPSGARLALAVRVGDAFVDSAHMRYLGRRFFAEVPELYFPPWLPQRMDWFLDGGAPPEEPSATIGFRRIGEAPVMEGRLDLTLEEARFLRRLGRNE